MQNYALSAGAYIVLIIDAVTNNAQRRWRCQAQQYHSLQAYTKMKTRLVIRFCFIGLGKIVFFMKVIQQRSVFRIVYCKTGDIRRSLTLTNLNGQCDVIRRIAIPQILGQILRSIQVSKWLVQAYNVDSMCSTVQDLRCQRPTVSLTVGCLARSSRMLYYCLHQHTLK